MKTLLIHLFRYLPFIHLTPLPVTLNCQELRKLHTENGHETQELGYFLIHSPNFSLSLTSDCTQQYYHTYFKHFLLLVLRKTSHSQISTRIGRSLYDRLLSVLSA